MQAGAACVDLLDVPSSPRLVALPSAGPTAPADDARVRAAAAVLAGAPVDAVASSAGEDPAQVLRWAEALLQGGAAAVGGVGLERPAEGPVASSVPVEDFLSVVAHELRTPLTAARTGLRVLASPSVDPETRGRVAATVLGRLAELERLTADLQTTVDVASGRRRPQPERVDLAPLVDEACAEVGAPVPEAAALHVLADPRLLRTAVTTLLGHAGRYAAPEDTAVRLQALPDAALLTVRLDGVDLDPERAQAMFEPFGAAARGDGNGLALYVVRTLAVASGGAVGVAGSSEGPVPATVLWVRLPLARPTSPAAPHRLPAVPPPALPLPRKDLP